MDTKTIKQVQRALDRHPAVAVDADELIEWCDDTLERRVGLARAMRGLALGDDAWIRILARDYQS